MIRLFTCLLAVCMTAALYAADPQIDSPVGVKHVLVVGWDGYGAHYVKWDEVPTLKKMKENGAWTLQTRCVLPSVSSINWHSILMGAGSELHGYRNWGSVTPEIPSRVVTERNLFPDIFYLIHTQKPDAETALAYTWKEFNTFVDSEKIKYQQWIDHDYDVLTNTTIDFLGHNPTLTFVYYSDPDHVGHSTGWGSDEYYAIVRDLDAWLGKIITYLEENDRMKDTLVIFVSDHGGTEKGHGKDLLSHMETPFILYGAGVKKGEIQDVVVNYDTAATIAWVLGLEAPQCWRGKPVTSAFETK